ncbi:DUF6088 family protein [Mycoplasmopsis fermentans]|uniref:DUF6088 family protein n=1 Tax=Mycoplasmopsis fermentans TaxID=2115 RepID=UPI000F03B6A4|nr:DUF6088 family protein [Mycoplasmopsis fermentans]RMX35263.1 hypothetical protein MFI2_0436 [Mycoplasmopsis fermentans MF-I2]RMX35399.1 hypothetical protein MFI1_0449 [Mycoplasmopsis fermentans MF-I1]
MNLKRKIINRINRFESGKVFIVKDFLDIANYETVKSTLNRLVKDKEIDKVGRGLYFKPEYIAIIDEYEKASLENIAKAIARKFNWMIVPSGNKLLNLLGLSTQVPAKTIYLTNGRNAKFKFGNFYIWFKHANNKEFNKDSELATIIMQAIKALGKGKVTKYETNYLKKKLSIEDKKTLLRDCRMASNWVYNEIEKICEVQ